MRYKERNREGEMGWRGAERVGVHVFVRVCVYVCECKHMYIYTTCVCVCVWKRVGEGVGVMGGLSVLERGLHYGLTTLSW